MTVATPPRSRTVAQAAIAVLLLAMLRLAMPPQPDPTGDTPTTRDHVPRPVPAGAAARAVAQARAFLDAYVDDGRVVRRDQGGDTVSEGQAWALLMSVALGDEDRATAIVEWTDRHLAREDGMLAWRWADGEVTDPQPAADADLVHAWALSMGAERFGRPTWQDRAEQLTAALARTSVVPTTDGPLLTAGPWAAEPSPVVVNPSYLWPAALAWAGRQEPALRGAEDAALALHARLVADDTPLVPDWVARQDGRFRAIGSPADPQAPAVHGFDAVRTWIWLAADCDPDVRALAAGAHEVFAAAGPDLPAIHDLAGTPTVEWSHPATLAGAAAAARAAGDEQAARARLDAATARHHDEPTYYGGAVTALARLLLDTDRIVSCG